MVIAAIRIGWLNENDMGVPFEIQSVEQISGKYGPELELMLMGPNGAIRKVGCYGGNQNYMVTHFGPETDAWVGKRIKVEMQEVDWKDGKKVIRRFSLV